MTLVREQKQICPHLGLPLGVLAFLIHLCAVALELAIVGTTWLIVAFYAVYLMQTVREIAMRCREVSRETYLKYADL